MWDEARRHSKSWSSFEKPRGKNCKFAFSLVLVRRAEIEKEWRKKYWNNQHPMINFMQILCQFNLKRFRNSGALGSRVKELQTKLYCSTNMKNCVSRSTTLALANYLPIMLSMYEGLCWVSVTLSRQTVGDVNCTASHLALADQL